LYDIKIDPPITSAASNPSETTRMTLRLVIANRDREGPHDPSPPTPPGVRITYHGGSVAITFGSTNKCLARGLTPRKSYAMPGTHDELSAFADRYAIKKCPGATVSVPIGADITTYLDLFY